MSDNQPITTQDEYASFAAEHRSMRRGPFLDVRQANTDAAGALRVDLREQGLRDTQAMPVVDSFADPEE